MEIKLNEKFNDLKSEYSSLTKASHTSKKSKQADTKYFHVVLTPCVLNVLEDKPLPRKEIFEFIKNHLFSMFIITRGLCYWDGGKYLIYYVLNQNSRMRLSGDKIMTKDNKKYLIQIFDKMQIPEDLEIDDKSSYYIENPINVKSRSFLKTYNFEEGNLSKFITSMKIEKPNELCKYGKQYEDNFLRYFSQPNSRDTSDFKYNFPMHMLEYLQKPYDEVENKGKYKAWEMIKEWFDLYCNMNPDRKKALIIFSKERCKGKTQFALNLVNKKNEHYIYNRGELDGNEFKEKSSTAKLVILDDLRWDFKTRTEQYKALMSSEPVTVRSCYIQYFFDASIPCIILMNNEHVFKRMLNSDDFKLDAYFVKVSDYMGPPGTEPKNRDKIMTNLTQEEYENIKNN